MNTFYSNIKFMTVLSIATGWMFYLLCYISRVEPGVLSNELMTEFNMTASEFGSVVSALYFTYCLMQIPNGILLDKLGCRTVMSVSALLCSLGIFIFGFATSTTQLATGRLILGIGSASGFIGCTKIISSLAPNKYSILVGISMFVGCLGGICGSVPTAYLVSRVGWRSATFVIASIGILIFILATRIAPMARQNKKDINPFDGIRILAKNPKFWMLGIFGAISYLPLSSIAELWCITYIEKKYAISTASASVSSTLIFIGYGIGSVITAALSNYFNSCKKVIGIFTILMIFTFIPIVYWNLMPLYICFSLLFLFGVFGGTIPLFFTISFKMAPEQYGGTSSGFINTIIMSGGFVFQPLLGRLLDYFRNGELDSLGLPYYTPDMYKSSFGIVLLCMILSLFLLFFIDDFCASEKIKQNKNS
jgi:MFS family permease